MHRPARLSTGIERLDELLGGGLLPGTLTVVAGATGIGKTHLGLQFAAAGARQEGRRGIVFDMSCRGDSQGHADYARRLGDWHLQAADPQSLTSLTDVFQADARPAEYLRVFDYAGKRPAQRESDFDAWQAWQVELMRKLQVTIGFFYRHFVRGVRRAVIDGIDPADRQADSVQFELFEYVYQQIIRKDAEWVARDLFREHYRAHATAVSEQSYAPGQIACLLLYTTHESLLDAMIERPLEDGDWLAAANTVLYLGKVRRAGRMDRALYVAKHRGSVASDEIVPYQIDERGVRIE